MGKPPDPSQGGRPLHGVLVPHDTLASAAPLEEDEDRRINSRDYVSSLARGLEILRAFSRKKRKMTLSEVAAETGITRAAARRFLLTLVHEGYAVADGKLFDLTPQVLELGFSVLSTMGTWEIARPFMERLCEEIEESCSAAVLDGQDVVYVSGVQVHRVISVGVAVGNRLPAHCTATGRVLIAGQEAAAREALVRRIRLDARTPRTVTDRARFREIIAETALQGWALVDQELETGLISIAIPLRSRTGRLAGAINVGVPTVRADPARMVGVILPRLRECTAQIGEALAR